VEHPVQEGYSVNIFFTSLSCGAGLKRRLQRLECKFTTTKWQVCTVVSRVQRRKLKETYLPPRYRGVHAAAEVRTKKEENKAKVLRANSNKAAREPQIKM